MAHTPLKEMPEHYNGTVPGHRKEIGVNDTISSTTERNVEDPDPDQHGSALILVGWIWIQVERMTHKREKR